MTAASLEATRVDPAGIAFRLARNCLLPASEPIVGHALSEEDWPRVLGWVEAERVGGLLARAVMDGAFPVTDHQLQDLGRIEQGAARTVLLLERLLLVAVDALETAGIDYRVMKGAALSHTVYDNPSLRHFGDIDLLVRGQDVDDAIEGLASAGIRRNRPELRTGFDRRFAKGITMYNQDRLSLDLHFTVASGWFGLRVDRHDLFAPAATFVVGGKTVKTLDRETALLGVCYNAVLGESSMRPRTSLDVAQLATGGTNPDRVYELAKRWGGEAILARAIDGAWMHLALPETDLSRWAASYTPAPRETRALRVHSTGERSMGREALVAMRAIKGFRDKTAYARALLFPNRVAMRRIGPRRYVAWWLRGARRMLKRGYRDGNR